MKTKTKQNVNEPKSKRGVMHKEQKKNKKKKIKQTSNAHYDE